MNRYWIDREQRAKKAIEHTQVVTEKYAELITNSVEKTKEYTEAVEISSKREGGKKEVILEAIDSVSALLSYHEGKTAVLNFASYKNAGGRFIDGSCAQEECLCHESFLYNVLREFEGYYRWNNEHKEEGMYTNRALYSPNILFKREHKEELTDVITCAAPNLSPAIKYGIKRVTKERNSEVLKSRIKFVLDIAEENEVDTIILGAYGCGVFKQDPEEVCKYFMECLLNTEYHFNKIIFAIPGETERNYRAFQKVINNYME